MILGIPWKLSFLDRTDDALRLIRLKAQSCSIFTPCSSHHKATASRMLSGAVHAFASLLTMQVLSIGQGMPITHKVPINTMRSCSIIHYSEFVRPICRMRCCLTFCQLCPARWRTISEKLLERRFEMPYPFSSHRRVERTPLSLILHNMDRSISLVTFRRSFCS